MIRDVLVLVWLIALMLELPPPNSTAPRWFLMTNHQQCEERSITAPRINIRPVAPRTDSEFWDDQAQGCLPSGRRSKMLMSMLLVMECWCFLIILLYRYLSYTSCPGLSSIYLYQHCLFLLLIFPRIYQVCHHEVHSARCLLHRPAQHRYCRVASSP
jgi:hypothetical protein